MNQLQTAAEWAFARAKSGTRLWAEDDAKPIDAEKTDDAWIRLFGESKPKRDEALIYIDLGDCLYYEFKGGRIHILDCTGSEIYQIENPGVG